MLLRKRSVFTGREAEMEFPDGIESRIALWQRSGMNIQDALPDLTPDQREFLLSGATPQEWDDILGDDEDAMKGDLEE